MVSWVWSALPSALSPGSTDVLPADGCPILIDVFWNSWSALAGVLIVGIGAGGPPVMIYSWIGVCLATLAVVYSLAEMCSAYPVSGGQYSWVALLAPPKIARGLSWVTGWFMIVGIVAMGATNNFITANFVLGMANLSHPGYVIERWHTVLVSWLVGIVAAGVNAFLPRLLNRISTAALCWNVLTFLVVIITILSSNHHKQPSSFVWKVSIYTCNFLPFENGQADWSSIGLSKLYRIRSSDGCPRWAATVLLRHGLL